MTDQKTIGSRRSRPTIFTRGDLRLFISYHPDGEGYLPNGADSKEPCMVISKQRDGRAMGKAWVIGLSSAWKYADANGYPTTWLVQKSRDIGNYIGVGDTKQACFRITSMILDYMPELLQALEYEMVEAERHKKIIVGDVAAYVAGELMGGTEITRYAD